MRINKIILSAAAAAMVVACNNASETSIKVLVGENLPGEVHIMLADLDTAVAVHDGVAEFAVPTDVTALGMVACGELSSSFIPEGKEVSVDFTGDVPALLAADGSLNAKLQDMNAVLYDIRETYMTKAKALEGCDDADSILSAFDDSMTNVMKGSMKDAISANPDNAVAVSALQQIYYELDEEDLGNTLALLSPALQENEFVKRVSSSLDAKKRTAEGMKFTDFTIEVDSANVVKFSDYVGNGKYVLVDFWASWCGPCRREVPNIINVWNKYKGDKFDVLGVAVWDAPENTLKAIEELGIEYDQIINAQRVPTELYGIDGIPQIMLFGPDGTIVRRNLRGEEIEKAVAENLKSE